MISLDNTRLPRTQSLIFLAVCLALVLGGLCVPLAGLLVRVSTDYGEGFNAYWAAAAMKSPTALYSPTHVMVANNYPPLSFYLIGEIGRAIGDNIIAGRTVALAAMVTTAVLAGWIVSLLGGTRRWAWIAGLLLLVYAEHLFGHFVAVDNPQWLAQALMLAGTIPLVHRESGPTKVDCLASAAAMIFAGLVKHNLFAFPIATALWLAVYHRGAFIRWALCMAMLAALACLLLDELYGMQVFIEIIAFGRTLDWQGFRAGLAKTACFIPMLLIPATTARRVSGDVRWMLFAAAGLLGVVLGIVQRLGAGVYINAHYEALTALVITTGYVFGNRQVIWRKPFDARPLQSALLLAVLIPVLIPLQKNIRSWSRQLRMQQNTQAQWAATIADLGNARNLALCEVPSLCYWAGKPFAVDFFAFGQKLRRTPQPSPLYGWISNRKAAIIIVEKPDPVLGLKPRLPAPYPALIDQLYRTVRILPTGIEEMAPRTGKQLP